MGRQQPQNASLKTPLHQLPPRCGFFFVSWDTRSFWQERSNEELQEMLRLPCGIPWRLPGCLQQQKKPPKVIGNVKYETLLYELNHIGGQKGYKGLCRYRAGKAPPLVLFFVCVLMRRGLMNNFSG